MKMADVMALIEQERARAGMSAEKFANRVGVTVTTYSRQNNNKQALGIDTLQRYAKYAKEVGNVDLLRALGAYALCLDPDEIIVNPSK
jgi:transcriptional regulator with XRE-family HTH domain